MDKKSSLLWQYILRHRRAYALGTVLMLLGTLLTYLSPLVVQGTIDGLLSASPSPRAQNHFAVRFVQAVGGPGLSTGWKLALAGILLVALSVCGRTFHYLRGRTTFHVAEEIARDLRMRLYDQLQRLPCSYHDKAQTGDLVQRCSSDVTTVRGFFSDQMIEVSYSVVLILTVVPIMLYLDWRHALLSLSLIPFMIGFAAIFFWKIRARFKEQDEAEGAMTTVIQENLTGIRVVRAFCRHDFEQQKFLARNARHRDLGMRMMKLMSVFWSISDLMTFMQMSLVLVVGAWRVHRHEITPGDLMAFLTYVGMYVWPLRQMGRVVAEMGKATIAAQRINEVLIQEPEISPPATTPLAPARGELRFCNVSFRHGEKTVLNDINLHVPAGQTLAIVGPSGSGKSSLIHLLLRFYDFQEGRILLDGVDIRQLPLAHLRRQFGVVMQEPFLYSKTISENIRLGQPCAADGQIEEVAMMAAVHESIAGFERQYQTMVGERGVTLSGGQRQRVAIARALLVNAPVLVLDDALSAVDTRTESTILGALHKRKGKQTTLLIAHRLSTLRQADRIVVLEEGRITQSGSHDELLEQEGLYRRLWQIQTALKEDLSQELAEEPELTHG